MAAKKTKKSDPTQTKKSSKSTKKGTKKGTKKAAKKTTTKKKSTRKPGERGPDKKPRKPPTHVTSVAMPHLKSTIVKSMVRLEDGAYLEVLPDDAVIQSAQAELKPCDWDKFKDFRFAYVNDPQQRSIKDIHAAYFKGRIMVSKCYKWAARFELGNERNITRRKAHARAEMALQFSEEIMHKNGVLAWAKMFMKCSQNLDTDLPQFQPQNFQECVVAMKQSQEKLLELTDRRGYDNGVETTKTDEPAVSIETINNMEGVDKFIADANSARIKANKERFLRENPTKANRQLRIDMLRKELTVLEEEGNSKPKGGKPNLKVVES